MRRRSLLPLLLVGLVSCGQTESPTEIVDEPPVVVDEPPEVAITAPSQDTTVTSGDAVTLTATASDPEDGDLTASIAWSSDLDGALGSGGTVTPTLSVGVHTITATVQDQAAQSASDVVTVTVVVAPELVRSPSSLSFNAVAGGSNPSSKTLQISNAGGGTLSWSVSDNRSWLSLSPSSGTSTGETDNVTVSIDISGLAAGTYNGTITAVGESPATNTPQTTAVTLTIVAPGLVLQWPVPGQEGADWVINNYVDNDPGSGLRDYRGGAKTYNGHRGTDIDVPNFRWMDNDHPIVAAHPGEVVSLEDGQPDRNTSCAGTSNFVNVRHDDGSTMRYVHLKKNSIVVTIGEQVSAGQTIGVVGSSGCSTQPHLHLELLDSSGGVVDPFLEELWADAPPYDTPLDLMDLNVKDGRITGIDEMKDPPPDATTMSLGSTVGVGVSMAGGTTGDLIRVTIRDDGGVLRHDFSATLQQTYRHSYWWWYADLATGTPGSWTIQVYTNGLLRRTYGLTVQ